MLPAKGCVTAIAKPTATAASTALPPFCNTETPTSAAVRFHRHHHPVPRAQRLPGRQRDRKEKAGCEHEKRDSSHRGIVVGRTAVAPTMPLMRTRPISVLAFCLAAAATWTVLGYAQQPRRFLYAAVPGVGNATNHGGVGILVFDIDKAYAFVKRIPTWTTEEGKPAEGVRGIAANAATGRLFVTTNRRLAAFDLVTDKVVWEQTYEQQCCDRMALSPDGKTLTFPPPAHRSGTSLTPPAARSSRPSTRKDRPTTRSTGRWSARLPGEPGAAAAVHHRDGHEDSHRLQTDRAVWRRGPAVHHQRQADPGVREHEQPARLRGGGSDDGQGHPSSGREREFRSRIRRCTAPRAMGLR